MTRIEVTWKYYHDNGKRAYKIVTKTVKVGRKKRNSWDLTERFREEYLAWKIKNKAYEGIPRNIQLTEFTKFLFKNKKISRATFYRYKNSLKMDQRWEEFKSEPLECLVKFTNLMFHLIFS